MRTVIAITGASGSNFAVNFIEKCPSEKYLVASKWGKRVIFEELGIKFDELKSMVNNTFTDWDLASPFASGSNHFDSLVIIPCSISTLNKIASGISDTLITRMAQIALKEKRRLIIAVRETPLDSITLENASKLSNAGAIIAPVSPGLYMNESSILDLADSFSNKILGLIGIEKGNGWRAEDINSSEGITHGNMTSGELTTYNPSMDEGNGLYAKHSENLSDLEKEIFDALLLVSDQPQGIEERFKTALDKLNILKSSKKDGKK